MNLLFEKVRLLMPDGHLVPGVLVVEGAQIAYVGPAERVPTDIKPHRTIDGRNAILMPGFANAHTHSPMTLLRGYAGDLPLEPWLEKVMAVEDRMTEEDMYWGATLAIQEMLASGVTCFADMYMLMDGVARAVADSGIRAVLSRSLVAPDAEGFARRVDEARALHATWNGAGGRITTQVGPHAVYTCDAAALKASVKLARELGVGIHTHLSESRKEVADCKAAHGCTPIAWMEKNGVFDVPTMAAHCCEATPEDIQILAKHQVSVTHTPNSNLKLANEIAPIVQMLDAGLNVSLGTDGAASNNNLDLWQEMSLTPLLQRHKQHDATAITPAQALQMATRNGYRAMGLDGGELRVGSLADLILVRTAAPWYRPGFDPVSDLVFAGDRGSVAMTVVAGRILYENGAWSTLQSQEVASHALKCARRLLQDA